MPSLKPTRLGQALGEPRQRLRLQPAVGAVVDDDAEPGGLAHRLDVGAQALLRRLGEIGRQQQQAVGARPARVSWA